MIFINHLFIIIYIYNYEIIFMFFLKKLTVCNFISLENLSIQIKLIKWKVEKFLNKKMEKIKTLGKHDKYATKK